jgi:hypothetical protein
LIVKTAIGGRPARSLNCWRGAKVSDISLQQADHVECAATAAPHSKIVNTSSSLSNKGWCNWKSISG